jgi:Uncharacterized relative of glutathione S-transferase, MAPEG superfamily
MAGIVIDLPREYGLVVWSVTAIVLECVLLAGPIGKLRKKLFTKEFLETNFGAEHKAATGTDIAPGGYPDVGCGRYSQKLSYKDWYDFNNAQRAHLNLVENIGLVIPMLLISGLQYPTYAAIVGFAYFISRFLYGFGYIKSGPPGRLVGAGTSFLCLIALVVMTVMTGQNLYNRSK